MAPRSSGCAVYGATTKRVGGSRFKGDGMPNVTAAKRGMGGPGRRQDQRQVATQEPRARVPLPAVPGQWCVTCPSRQPTWWALGARERRLHACSARQAPAVADVDAKGGWRGVCRLTGREKPFTACTALVAIAQRLAWPKPPGASDGTRRDAHPACRNKAGSGNAQERPGGREHGPAQRTSTVADVGPIPMAE
jgi:hypothetical protein